MVVGKIHRPIAGDVVRIEDSAIPKVSDERIRRALPSGKDRPHNRRIDVGVVIFQMTFEQLGLRQDVIIDKQNEIAHCFSNSNVARWRRASLELFE
jgi:hypothetical protein